MVGNSLIEKAIERYEELRIVEINSAGVHRDPARELRTGNTGNFVVTYPETKDLSPMSVQELLNLDDKNEKESLAIYCHIPFCSYICDFCGYVKKANQSLQKVNEYFEALVKEIHLVSSKLNLNQRKVKSVHFGGGTPTYLSAEQLIYILDTLSKAFHFESEIEITVEASPETVLYEKLCLLRKGGFNRFSMGIQTLSEELLAECGRRHTTKQALEALRIARDSGFKHINVDLMYGLPQQNLMDIQGTINNLSNLGNDYFPDSFTTYFTVIKNSTGLKISYDKNPTIMPSEKEIHLMHLILKEWFKQIGFIENPVDWFSKPNFTYNQQLQKWQDDIELIGLGVSSYGFIRGCQYRNYFGENDYIKAIEQGKVPIAMGHILNKEERFSRRVIFGLKTLEHGVDKIHLSKEYGIETDEFYKNQIQRLTKLGLIINTAERLKLTEKGTLFSDEVCRMFYV